MNGDAEDKAVLPSSQSSLRTAAVPSSYSSSPRQRRLEDMKKSYLTGGASGPLSSGYTSSSVPSYTSKYGGAASYRLASLDRLAQRQKLYETAGGVDGCFSSSNGSAPLGTPSSPNGIVSGSSSNSSGTPNSPRDSTREVSVATVSMYNSSGSRGVELQTKREMFFKAESGSGGNAAPLAPPTSAPPAPPVTAPAIAPPPPPTLNGAATPAVTTASTNSSAPSTPTTTTTSTTTSVASIKEQLLTSKDKDRDRKEHKDEENKENKLAKERRTRHVDGYVGFANLPNQVHRKAVKKGFEFSFMVVGESGLGKSTLINSMFMADIYSGEYPGPSHRVKKTVQVETTKVLMKENGVSFLLTVVDTPGFGDAVDNSNCWQPLIDFIENRYEEYLNAESRVHRKQIKDSRVHCCLYFIAPSGHGLKPLDVEFMRRLHDKVNIIPVIAKADTLTPEECQHLKKQILNEIAQHKIKIYEFPDDDGDSNTARLKQRVPFAVVGSNTVIEVDGKKLRGRKYPWGVVEVENLEHCDFIPLRNMLIRTHMQDLKGVTNNVHYENYRCRKLAGIGAVDGKGKMSNKNPLAQMEEEKKDHSSKMKKMEAEMVQVFEMKVKEKMNKLAELEADLQKRNESMRKKLEADLAEQEEERERFEKDKKAWENANGVTIEELRRKSLESLSKEHVDGKEKHKKKNRLF